MKTLLIVIGMTMSVWANANEGTVLLNDEEIEVGSDLILLERTENTPEKVKISMPITFHRTYCVDWETYTEYVPCPEPTSSSSNDNDDDDDDSGSSDPRPHHGNPGRPPHPGTSPHRPHSNLKCTSTYTVCVAHETKAFVERETFVLKFKGDAKEFLGTEIYQLAGKEYSDYRPQFSLSAKNDLAKTHKIKHPFKSRAIVK